MQLNRSYYLHECVGLQLLSGHISFAATVFSVRNQTTLLILAVSRHCDFNFLYVADNALNISYTFRIA